MYDNKLLKEYCREKLVMLRNLYGFSGICIFRSAFTKIIFYIILIFKNLLYLLYFIQLTLELFAEFRYL